ncbi:MAG TPA: aminoglycoside phosphotransferase family protein, partial [Terriglobales bacterium]|nr:aminoglycoside phosphotransferase family protein [Terriglobales bacterium]
CNPDHETSTMSGRLAHRVELIAKAAALERARLLQWILAWAGLSAVWLLDDGVSPESSLRVAELAAAELAGDGLLTTSRRQCISQQFRALA